MLCFLPHNPSGCGGVNVIGGRHRGRGLGETLKNVLRDRLSDVLRDMCSNMLMCYVVGSP